MKRKVWIKLFLLYLGLIIPVLSVSVLMVVIVSNKMQAYEEQETIYLLRDGIENFRKDYVDYYEESVLLLKRPEASPYRINGDPIEIYNLIQMLKSKKEYDSRTYSEFLYYGTDHVYASAGVARKQFYFREMLGCNEESVERGLEIIESGEICFTFLFTSGKDGYMLYSFPGNRGDKEVVSNNILISFNQIERIFKVMDTKQWYQLETGDGMVLSVGRNDNGRTEVLSEEECQKRLNSNRYRLLEESIEELNLKVRLYYEEFSFGIGSGIYRIQLVNMVLIVLATIISIFVSWKMSEGHANQILHLERIAKGNTREYLSERNIYNSLQSVIVSGLNKVETLEKNEIVYVEKIRRKTTALIFSGGINSAQGIKEAFDELGLREIPKSFFVGVVSTATRLMEDKLPFILMDCIRLQITHESLEVLIFLYKAEESDVSQLQRKKVAEEIRTGLYQKGIRKVRIGMSQIYSNLLMIDCAYKEAIEVLEHIIFDKPEYFCGCWENITQHMDFLLPNMATLQKFSDALTVQDIENAKSLLHDMLMDCSLNGCTEKNKAYLKYTILQCLVNYLSTDGADARNVFIKRCLNINVTDDIEFSKAIIKILEQCLVKKKADSFANMLDYIEKNYHRSDLAYEEIAAVGKVNKTYISKLFRSKLGMSYIEYLTFVRMEKACILLQTTDYDINEIVKMVGYENASSFRRSFKNRYGISANDYRKKKREI